MRPPASTISDEDIQHAVEHALVVAESEEDTDKVLYLGPIGRGISSR
jgi:hypothetical protein